MPETDNITQGQLAATAKISPIQSALNDNDDALNAALNALTRLTAHVGHIEAQCVAIVNLVKRIEDITRRLEV